MSIDKDLQGIISLITAGVKPVRILLFGSRSRDAVQSDSDFDLCVIYDKLPKRKLEVLQDLYQSLFPLQCPPVDLVVYEKAEYERKVSQIGSFEARIAREGLLVYGE